MTIVVPAYCGHKPWKDILTRCLINDFSCLNTDYSCLNTDYSCLNTDYSCLNTDYSYALPEYLYSDYSDSDYLIPINNIYLTKTVSTPN